MTSYPMQPKSKQTEIGDPFRAPPSGQRLYYSWTMSVTDIKGNVVANIDIEQIEDPKNY